MACRQEPDKEVISCFKTENDEVKNEKPANDLQKNVEIVVKTWALVKQDLLKHGTAFYIRLFTDHPELKGLFSFASDTNADSMKDNPGLQRQAKLLMSMIDYAVRSLDDLTKLIPKLKRLGQRHFTKYHVKPEHFQPVGESLLGTLREGLGEMYTNDVESAWSAIYSILAEVMIEGGMEANSDDSSGSVDDK